MSCSQADLVYSRWDLDPDLTDLGQMTDWDLHVPVLSCHLILAGLTAPREDQDPSIRSYH